MAARTMKIIGWSGGILVLFIAIMTAAIYLFSTSEWARNQVESRATTYSGRKTTIGDMRIEWGSTVHVHLTNL